MKVVREAKELARHSRRRKRQRRAEAATQGRSASDGRESEEIAKRARPTPRSSGLATAKANGRGAELRAGS